MTEVRRSKLQRKDRGELIQIATALGGRPSRRARKEEIIRLIIDLKSGNPDGAAAAPALGEDGRPAEAKPAAGAEDDVRSEEGAESAGRRAPSTARKSDRNSSSARRRQAGASRARKTRAGRSDSDGERSSGAEPGNRRRRRRSRARDHDRDKGWAGDAVDVDGRLDLRDEGYGFLRVEGCLPNRNDAYVPVKTIRQFRLRRGDHLVGTSRPANRSEKNPALLDLASVNGVPAGSADRPLFEQLTPAHADRRLVLEQPGGPSDPTARLVDLVAPLGLGQRVLVRAPRRSGAAALLSAIISSIEASELDIYPMGLFLDQRPEMITERQRMISEGEVAATAFDQPAEEHVQTAEMTVERAKRLAESGQDVVVVLDGLTALARAYNTALSNAGKAYTGKVENGAVHMPKKLFGAGRNLAEAGSVTMIATIVDDTHRFRSLDRVVCQEFAGTANTEIRLDRWAAERGLSPAVNLLASASHDEQHFIGRGELRSLRALRRSLVGSGSPDDGDSRPGDAVPALQAALARLDSAPTNAELLEGG